jgi:hypothetical protein
MERESSPNKAAGGFVLDGTFECAQRGHSFSARLVSTATGQLAPPPPADDASSNNSSSKKKKEPADNPTFLPILVLSPILLILSYHF